MMYRWKFVRTSDDCSGCTWRDNLEEVEDNLYDYLTQAAATNWGIYIQNSDFETIEDANKPEFISRIRDRRLAIAQDW